MTPEWGQIDDVRYNCALISRDRTVLRHHPPAVAEAGGSAAGFGR